MYEAVRDALEGFRLRNAMAFPVVESSPRASTEWSPIRAYRFLQFLPTPVVVKDLEARIIWCNFAYEDEFGFPLTDLTGKTITELGLVGPQDRVRVEADIKSVVETGTPMEFLELMTIPKKGDVLYRAQRFIFEAHPGGKRYLGDITFNWNRVSPGRPLSMGATRDRLRKTVVPPQVLELCIPFLERCPTSIALKTSEAKVIWCNAVFLRLAGADRMEDVTGKTAQQIWGLGDFDKIVVNDFSVAAMDVWTYEDEQLPGWPPRTSLRFPIFDLSPSTKLIGVVSSQFQLSVSPYSSQPLIEQTYTSGRQN